MSGSLIGVFKTWEKKVDEKHKAYCKVCMKSFSVSGLGVTTLDTHEKEKGHLLKCPLSNQQKLKFQSTEKDEATDRSENKEHSTCNVMTQTTAQSCFS